MGLGIKFISKDTQLGKGGSVEFIPFVRVKKILGLISLKDSRRRCSHYFAVMTNRTVHSSYVVCLGKLKAGNIHDRNSGICGYVSILSRNGQIVYGLVGKGTVFKLRQVGHLFLFGVKDIYIGV